MFWIQMLNIIFFNIMEHSQQTSFIQQDPNQHLHPVNIIQDDNTGKTNKKKVILICSLVLGSMLLIFLISLPLIKAITSQPQTITSSIQGNQNNKVTSREPNTLQNTNYSNKKKKDIEQNNEKKLFPELHNNSHENSEATNEKEQQKDDSNLNNKVKDKNSENQAEDQKQASSYHFDNQDITTIIQNQAQNKPIKYKNETVQSNLNFLIISYHNNAHGYPQNLNSLEEQSFQNWQAVYYRSTIQNFSFENKQKIKVLKSSGNKCKDIYEAIVTFSQEESLILLLDENQDLQSKYQLESITKSFSNPSIYAGLLSYIVDLKIIKVSQTLLKFRRDAVAQTKKKTVYFQLTKAGQDSLSLILNHFRIFRSSFYKRIMYFDLMNDDEQFYQSELSFLLPLFEMKNSTMKIQIFKDPTIKIKDEKHVIADEEIKQIFYHTIYHSFSNKTELKLLPNHNISALSRKRTKDNSQEFIPKTIHRITLESIKPYQQLIINATDKVYDGYKSIIWTRENITLQNFPKTSQYVLSILNSNEKLTQKQERQLKTVMMWEILYIHGGIYFDTAYQLFRNIPNLQNQDLSMFMDSGLTSDHVSNKIMAAKARNQFLSKLLTDQFFTNFKNSQENIFSVQYLLNKMTLQDFFVNIKIFSAWRLSTRIIDVIDIRRAHSDCYLSIACEKMGWNFGFQHWRIKQQAAVYKKQNFNTNNFSKIQTPELCFLSIVPSSIQNFIKTNQMLESQTFANWKAHYFVYEQKDVNIRLEKIKQQYKDKIHIYIGSGNSGRDTYDGMINKCSYDSIAVLIDEGEVLYDQKTAELYSEKFRDNNVYLVAGSFIQNGKIVNPNTQLFQFRRDNHFIKNQNLDLPINMMQTIRLIRCQMYRRIGYFDLMYQNQTFYSEKASYLYPLIQFRCKRQCKFNKGQTHFKTPEKILQIVDHPLYKTNKIETIKNKIQLLELNKKMIHPPTQDIINFAFMKHPHGSPLTNDPLLWGNKFNVLQRNISDTDKIPKIVHQIWVGQQIPNFKMKLMNRVKTILEADGYQYKLWKNENITRQNFPLTYDYIQKLIQIDKTSQFTRFSMVADFIKTQALYHHGGFYIDTNIEVFKTLTPLLKYPFVATLDMAGFQGQYISSLMGAEKNSKFLKRIFQPEVLQTLNLYEGPKSNIQTGPAFFGRAFYPQDYFFNMKILPPQKVFPFVKYGYDKRYRTNKCSFPKNRNAFANLKGKYDQIIIAQKFKILHPCRMYPDAYTSDYFELGASWKKARF